jgi:peptidyl-prolyl cis-trans isomerase C
MRLPFLGAAGVACAVTWSAAGADASTSLFADPVLAKGQGVEVRRSRLEDAFVAYKGSLAMRGQTIPEDKRTLTEAQLLDRLIVGQLMVGKATAADRVKAEEKAAKFLEESRKSAGSEEALFRNFRALGITPQQLTNRVLEQAISEELLGRELKSKITIPSERVQQVYDTNDAAFRQPETVRAAQIMVFTRDPRTRLELPDDLKKAKREKAEKALARARKGEDFTKLVEEFSEDPLTKENKGEIAFVRAKDDPMRAMVPELEVAAFALKPGSISDVIKTEFGFHILKLLEITPARKVPYTEVSDRIRELLTTQELEKQLPDYFAKLKKEAGVEILDDKLREALAQAQKEPGRLAPGGPTGP